MSPWTEEECKAFEDGEPIRMFYGCCVGVILGSSNRAVIRVFVGCRGTKGL